MTQKLVIFGAGQIAELAYYYFKNDSDYDVVAFMVDAPFLRETMFLGLPVFPFGEVLQRFPPDHYSFFVAMSYKGCNSVRLEKYLAVKALGYRCANYISSRASLLNEGRIGDNCFILEDNTVQPLVTIGNNVTLWSGNHIGHHSVIHDHCFISSQVVVSGGVVIGEACFIGVNATLRDHVRIGPRCVIGAGALLLSDAEGGGVYMADPTPRARVPSSRLRDL